MSENLGFDSVTTDQDYYFISYNSDDIDRVQPIAKGLFEAGLPLWYDYALEHGKEWEKQIAQKIHDSKAVLLFLTKGVVQKEDTYVRKEFDMATQFFGKTVYIVVLDKIKNSDVPVNSVPWYMEVIKRQLMDMTKGQSLNQMILEIKKVLGRARLPITRRAFTNFPKKQVIDKAPLTMMANYEQVEQDLGVSVKAPVRTIAEENKKAIPTNQGKNETEPRETYEALASVLKQVEYSKKNGLYQVLRQVESSMKNDLHLVLRQAQYSKIFELHDLLIQLHNSKKRE